jgi:hypothetical protein
MSHPQKIFDKDILLKIQGYSQELGFELFGITRPLLQKEDYDYLKRFIEEKKICQYALVFELSRNST